MGDDNPGTIGAMGDIDYPRAADPELRRGLGERAHALAREWFDVVPLAGSLAGFYRRCVAESAARAARG